MLKQATVEDISNSRITKRHGRILVTTRYYPRFLKKKFVDEYLAILAPTKELLTEFKESEAALENHDQAFEKVSYEEKFTLDEGAREVLRNLAEISREQDVYLVCHCRIGQRCHREILMLIAQKLFDAQTARIHNAYATIEERLSQHPPKNYKSLWR